MDIARMFEELKALSPGPQSPFFAKLAELEGQVRALMSEHSQKEQQLNSRLGSIRHEVAQPLTTVQLFLDLLPSVMKQEQMVVEKLVNPRFWTQTHARAVEAVRQIPGILGKPRDSAASPHDTGQAH